MLKERGSLVLDGDQAGHAVLEEPEVRSALRDRFASRVFAADGQVDRRAVARIVFSPQGSDDLEFLERLTFPRIAHRLLCQAQEADGDRLPPLIVLDAAVMLKAGWDAECDGIVFVDAPRDVRLARARSRGWTEKAFSDREAVQESLEEKRSRADWVIDNGGSPEALRLQLDRLWPVFTAVAPHPPPPAGSA
jgi:dephospho-CoA kinase